jgi:hypothetical protein
VPIRRNFADPYVAYMPVATLGYAATGGNCLSAQSVEVDIGDRHLIPGNRIVSIRAGHRRSSAPAPGSQAR